MTGTFRAILCVIPALACTPLGLWVYDDPKVSVARVRLPAESSEQAPVVVALAVRNPNDFPISTARVELQLLLDGLTVGWLTSDSMVSFPKSATSTLAVSLDRSSGVGPAQLRILGTGTHHFAVNGRTTFTTPFGERKIRFAEEGKMTFGQPASPASGPVDPSE
jgi:LEA14-like dessication related protein